MACQHVTLIFDVIYEKRSSIQFQFHRRLTGPGGVIIKQHKDTESSRTESSVLLLSGDNKNHKFFYYKANIVLNMLSNA